MRPGVPRSAEGEGSELRSLLGLHVHRFTPRSLAGVRSRGRGLASTTIPPTMPQADIDVLVANCESLDACRCAGQCDADAARPAGVTVDQIARLQLDDLDRRAGDLLVRGKARRTIASRSYSRRRARGVLGVARPTRLAECVLDVAAPTRPIRARPGRRCRASPLPVGGVPHVGPHRLRHTLATRMLGQGAALATSVRCCGKRTRDDRDLRKGRPRPPTTGRAAVAGSGTMSVLKQHLDEYLHCAARSVTSSRRRMAVPRFVTYLDEHAVEFVTVEVALASSLEREVPAGSVVPSHRMMVAAGSLVTCPGSTLGPRSRPPERSVTRAGGGDRSSIQTRTCSP